MASYQAGAVIPMDGDPPEWWKKNECNYTHAARIAHTVPTTPVPSERPLSAAKDNVSGKRSTQENVDSLTFFKNKNEIVYL